MALEARRGQATDLPALIDLFWHGVHEGAAPRYTMAQRNAWLPARPTLADFAARLEAQAVFVADAGAGPVGFMTLTDAGYLDLAFVRPDLRQSGTADLILAHLLNHALTQGMRCLTVRASDMARSFFARQGWQVVGPAPQMRNGVVLPATDMRLDVNVEQVAKSA